MRCSRSRSASIAIVSDGLMVMTRGPFASRMLETFTFLLLCLPQSYPSLHRPLCFLSISPPPPYDITDDYADEGGPRLGKSSRSRPGQSVAVVARVCPPLWRRSPARK